jgi:hypothetical protein
VRNEMGKRGGEGGGRGGGGEGVGLIMSAPSRGAAWEEGRGRRRIGKEEERTASSPPPPLHYAPYTVLPALLLHQQEREAPSTQPPFWALPAERCRVRKIGDGRATSSSRLLSLYQSRKQCQPNKRVTRPLFRSRQIQF